MRAKTVGAATYLASKLIDKFANNLQPTNITVSTNPARISITFAGGMGSSDAVVNPGVYDAA